ncbi:phenylacetate--CoA ligase family protein [Flavobacterium branchiicola]|uniref:Phenylacetate--CoA ligase family protein n=1 Tax=Flavobacterium branchiicola TaxID=1114875 RepID=A0ABV9PFD0_9FLAO|nr:phenylacetate--CoA ligase family protein [Flavobacterium branchiicola]MBS7255188.1 phenylacetate--CoA ligase family protein [Flavobacterium branchiicola]
MIRLFDLTLQLNGFPIKKAKAEFDKITAIPEENFDAYIEQKKIEIVNYHLNNNNFYKELANINSYKNWSDLPVLNKRNLQKPLIERLSKGFSQKNVYINKTSGSSGDPMVFAKDKFAHAITWADNIHRFSWHNIDFNFSFQARFYGMPLSFLENKKLRLKDFLSHRYRFNIFDLSDKKLEIILEKFQKSKFDYINGYTTNIVLMAKYLKKKNKVLTEICPTLKSCVVTSEMLFEDDRVLLEKHLGVPVINEYGSSEIGLIAFENSKGEWQVNSDTLFVEIVDENDQPVPLGQEGRILITNLYNKAHPFIRYEVGDYGILDEKSTPKKPILKKLIGRNNDVAILPSGKKSPGMTFYSITKKLFGDDGNVKEFIIKQTKTDTFEIEYTSENELSNFEIDKIEKVFSTYLEPNLKYIFIRKDKLERSKSGKLKQFTSYF